MTRRATLFAHGKCSPAEAVHPIQPLLRGRVFPATPRANACRGGPGAGAAWRPRQHKAAAAKPGSRGRLEIVSAGRLGDREKGPIATPMAQAPRRPGAGRGAPGDGARKHTPRARDCRFREVRQEVLVRGLVLRDDRRGDTAALADLVPALL